MVNIFVCVIGSFEIPCYSKFIAMRKAQMNELGIPYMFIYDDITPPEYPFDSKTDICIPKIKPPYPVANELNSRPTALNPHMILKFLKALQTIDESKYDYIIRVNLSTFIHFENLRTILQEASRTKYAGGNTMKFPIANWRANPVDPFEFISGTCMIFSKDVITMLKTIEYEYYILYEHNDDVVLSYLVKLYTEHFHHIPMRFIENDSYPTKEDIHTYSIFRIKHYINRDRDIDTWKFLLQNIYSYVNPIFCKATSDS